MKITKERIGVLGLGYLGNAIVDKMINWGVDPLIVLVLNSGVGGFKGMALTWAALSIVSFIACYATLLFYDWSKTDWLGIEATKELKEDQGDGWIKRLVARFLRLGDNFALVALSVVTDPFIVVAYMRHGANQYNGMTKRDWKIFLVSIVICNGWEATYLYGGIEAIKHLVKMF